MSKKSRDEEPVDVLAAEEFPVGEAAEHEPSEAEQPHDVLAADEFAMPAPDPALHDQGDEFQHEPDESHMVANKSPQIIALPAWAAAAIVGAVLVILGARRCSRRKVPRPDAAE